MRDIMDELGFRAEGSDAVKRAFVKNLVREAHKNSRAEVVPKKHKKKKKSDQMTFFDPEFIKKIKAA